MTCTTREVDTGGKLSREFERICDGERVGYIRLRKAAVKGRSRWEVSSILVNPGVRRAGHATKLYEAAANLACSKRSSLVSTGRNPGAYSNDFWRKLYCKGKADIVGVNDHGPIFETSCEHAGDLSGARKTMPKKVSGRCVGVRKKMTKRCSEHSMKENIRHCMCLTTRPREQCVAIAYAQLEKSCGVHPRKRQTPKKIVAASKAKRSRGVGSLDDGRAQVQLCNYTKDGRLRYNGYTVMRITPDGRMANVLRRCAPGEDEARRFASDWNKKRK